MSVRKNSVDEYSIYDDTTIAGDDLNQAMCMSFSDTLSDTRRSSVSDSVPATVKSKVLSQCNTIYHATTEHGTVQCTPRIINEEIVLEPHEVPEKGAIGSRFPEKNNKTSNHLITGVINEEKSANVGEPRMDFDMKSVQRNILRESLNSFEENLNNSTENTPKDYSSTMENLNEVFTYSPRTFTESLMTIVEESFVESQEKSGTTSMFFLIDFLKNANAAGKFFKDQSPSNRTFCLPEKSKKIAGEFAGDSLSPEMSKFLSEGGNVQKLLEDESLPEGAQLLPKESNIYTDQSVSLSTLSELGNSALMDESTQYLSSNTRKLIKSGTPKIDNKTFIKTPKIIVSSAKPIRNIPSAVRDRKSPKSQSPRKVIYAKTPKIIVSEEITEDEHLMVSPRRSPLRSNDDDEYLTAESDTDESGVLENTQMETSSKTISNMSIIASNHKEWLKKYQQISRDKKLNNYEKPSECTDRKRKLSSYMNKLEKQSIKELKEKRQKCFDLVEEMLKNPTASIKEPQVKSPCVCHPCKLSKEFCKVLAACYEYAQCALDANQIYESPKKKKITPSVASQANLKPRQLVSPRKMRRTPIKTRRSLNKSPSPRLVATRLKLTASPSNHELLRVFTPKGKEFSDTDSASLRPVSQLPVGASQIYELPKKKQNSTLVASQTMTLEPKQLVSPCKIRKTPIKTRRSLNKSPSPRIVATRLKLTPSPSNYKSPGVSNSKGKEFSNIDSSSLRPVSQLRKVFSPRFNTAGSTNSKIPGGSKPKSKNLAIVGKGQTTSVRFVAKPLPETLTKIISPVGEYIRGGKKA